MKPFSEILRQLAQEYNMTHEEIARRADISLPMVRKMSSGARPNPGRSTIAGLAKAFGVSPAVFFE